MSKLFDELAALKEAYDTKLAEEGEDAVKELFKDFFDKHPKAKAVTWCQYTPYFNDGDPCYFRVGELNLHLDEEEEEAKSETEEVEATTEVAEEEESYYDYGDEGHTSYSLSRSKNRDLKKMGKDFEKLEGIPEDIMESVFGDHVKILATRKGFNVSEYDHD